MPIDGSWQFHLGDDPSWAQPNLDDSRWESIDSNIPWGGQNHPSYTGFAWYRRHLDIRLTAGEAGRYNVLFKLAKIVRGLLERKAGRPIWPAASTRFLVLRPVSSTFPLPASTAGVLAVRFWKAPLDAFYPAEIGGLFPSLCWRPNTISLAAGCTDGAYSRATSSTTAWSCCASLSRCFAWSLWYRDRKEISSCGSRIYTASPVASIFSTSSSAFPFPWNFARCLNQPIYVLYHVSLWFLLVWLLRLHENRLLCF